MQDRFKFRVWDKENFNYLEFEGFKKGEIEFNFDIDTNSIWIEFDHNKYILEQCTGLKDKNSKLIYEGDIIKDINIPSHFYIVEWFKGGFELKSTVSNSFLAFDTTQQEVIGNIYENKELLNE